MILDDIMEKIDKVLSNSRSIEWKKENSKKTVLSNIKKNLAPILEGVSDDLGQKDASTSDEHKRIKYGRNEVVQLHNNKDSSPYRVMTEAESSKGDKYPIV